MATPFSAVDVRDPESDSAVAIAFAAKAVDRWYAPGSDRGAALKSLMDAMAWAARATGRFPTWKPGEFLALLSLPLATWLPVQIDECLVEEKEASDYCWDRLYESGNDPEAELVQNLVGGARATFALRANGETEYAEFRRFLIQNGCCRETDAIKALAPSGLRPADLYEKIPANCRFPRGGKDFCWPCPVCSWPMRIREKSVECFSPTCRSEGARYRTGKSASSLTPIGSREHRSLWRRIVDVACGAGLGVTHFCQDWQSWT